jgi:hypothetical protein
VGYGGNKVSEKVWKESDEKLVLNLFQESSDYRRLRIKCHAELVSASNKINKLSDPEINSG